MLKITAEHRGVPTSIHISLMSQYSPQPGGCLVPELNRAVTEAEYNEVLDEMDFLGLENGWIQELESSDCYQPDFDKSHPFET